MKKFNKRLSFTRALSVILALVLAVGLIAVPGMASSYTILPDGYYMIYTNNGTTCLNVQYARKDGGLACVDVADLQDNEIWYLDSDVYGWFTLSPKHAPNHYLTANGFDKQLSIRKVFPSNAASQWRAISVGGGKYVFQNRANPSCVIDCRCGDNGRIGNPFLLYTRNGFAAAQSLLPIQISTSSTLTPGTRVTNFTPGYYKIALYYDRNQVLNAQYGAKSGSLMVCDTYNGEFNEVIYICRETSSGLYSLRFAANTDLCIAPSSVSGGQMKVQYYDGSRNCMFEIYKVGSTYCFRSAATGLMIDDYYCRTAVGTPIVAVPYNQCPAQQFYVTRVSVPMSTVLYKLGSPTSKLTCGFDGYKELREKYGYRHEGIDFAYGSGKTVYSLTEGEVISVRKGSSSSLSTVAIYYAAANKTVIYLHLAPTVSVGTTVRQGTAIGTESSRGSSAIHTHVEVRNGKVYSAAVSSNRTLENSNPTSFWNSLGYLVK